MYQLLLIQTGRSIVAYCVQIHKDSLHPTTQSEPDLQTAPHQARNTWRSCNAARSLHRSTSFAGGRARICYPLLWFLLSDGPSRCSFRTTRGCRLYRSSHVGCRFGRSGSSGFVDVFRLLRWYGCVPVQRVVAVGIGVDIGISTVPNESGFLFEAVWKLEITYVRSICFLLKKYFLVFS